jgi:hypothetical protein
MAVDHIRYDILTQEALRGVVRTVLSDTASNGLPGEHHFFITFDPRSAGVQLSKRMREQYPEEMTVVLQHQFWDLTVSEDRFEVGMSFGGVAEKVIVPFAAILRFVDPSVQFGVEFEQLTATDTADSFKEDAASGTAAPATAATPVLRPPAEHKPARAELAAVAPPSDEPPQEVPAGGQDGAEIVRLDRFRKK